MSDPISIIALGAAVGGAAGKLAEKAWDNGQRWLKERFGSYDHDVQEKAQLNAAHFIEHLAKRVELLEKETLGHGLLLENVVSHPQFSVLLQKSLLNAAQTDDETKQDLLAELVAARLTSNHETTFSLASQLASDAIAHSTKQQLQLMALSFFVQQVRPKHPLSATDYRRWLEVWLKPFEYFEFVENDALHLVAIACASYDPASERDLTLLLQMKGGTNHLKTDLTDLIEVEVLQMQWVFGLSGVFLTSVGSIVGGLALDQMIDSKYELPK